MMLVIPCSHNCDHQGATLRILEGSIPVKVGGVVQCDSHGVPIERDVYQCFYISKGLWMAKDFRMFAGSDIRAEACDVRRHEAVAHNLHRLIDRWGGWEAFLAAVREVHAL